MLKSGEVNRVNGEVNALLTYCIGSVFGLTAMMKNEAKQIFYR